MPRSVEELETLLSEPAPAVIETLSRVPGDILILGAGGKMGPTLARMTQRASAAAGLAQRVIAVSRFSSPSTRYALEVHGIETIACDLLDEREVSALPDAPNVIFMAGMKFGSNGRESLTWAINVWVPILSCWRHHGSRVVAFSTGNVYGLTPVARGGSLETDAPSPVGEYAMSCLGRERMFEFFSERDATPVALIRLNYACELRYGVLVDIARKVRAGEAIDLAMGYFNVIWQGDACAMALRALEHAALPPAVLNVTGQELLGVREVAERFAHRFGKPALFAGSEAPTALLSNAGRAIKLFGKPRVGVGQMIDWIADWIIGGGELLNKPTHFESRDGRF